MPRQRSPRKPPAGAGLRDTGVWSEKEFSKHYNPNKPSYRMLGAANSRHRMAVPWKKHRESAKSGAELERLKQGKNLSDTMRSKAYSRVWATARAMHQHEHGSPEHTRLAKANEAAEHEVALHGSRAHAFHNAIRHAAKWHNAVKASERAARVLGGKKPKTVKVKKGKPKVVGKKLHKGAKAHKRTKPRAKTASRKRPMFKA